jgi:hypothetical protein
MEAGSPARAEWGNAMARATLGTRIRGLDVRHTVSWSRHSGEVFEAPDAPASEFVPSEVTGASDVDFSAFTGSVSPQPGSLAGPDWTLGYALEQRRVGYGGPLPRGIPAMERQLASSGFDTADTLQARWRGSLPMLALWGERSWSRDERLALRAGLRLEAGDAPSNAGPIRIAPRVSARFAPWPEVAFSAGAGRVYQYVQSVAPGGVHLASLASTDAWLLAGPEVPAIRADMATAGVEAWLAPGRLAAINAFGRRGTGMVLPDPRPGPLEERVTTVTGRNDAYGIEVSARQLTGRVTGSVAYTLSRSRMTAAGLEFPAGSDRTHVLDLTALARVRAGLRVGAALTAATGVPFTRAIADEEECAQEPDCDPDSLPWMGEPHATRAPTFASLDLLLDWGTRVGAAEVGVYGQLRNVLDRRNATVYTGDGSGCIVIGCGSEQLRNAYERGVPRLPVVGVRVRY